MVVAIKSIAETLFGSGNPRIGQRSDSLDSLLTDPSLGSRYCAALKPGKSNGIPTLVSEKKFKKWLSYIGASPRYQKNGGGDYYTMYKGHKIHFAIKHNGEKKIKKPYIYRIIQAVLKIDGYKEGTTEYTQKYDAMKKQAASKLT